MKRPVDHQSVAYQAPPPSAASATPASRARRSTLRRARLGDRASPGAAARATGVAKLAIVSSMTGLLQAAERAVTTGKSISVRASVVIVLVSVLSATSAAISIAAASP